MKWLSNMLPAVAGLAGLCALSLATAAMAEDKPDPSPSVTLCRAAFLLTLNAGATDARPAVDLLSAKIGQSPEQAATQRAICGVYFIGVNDGAKVATMPRT